MAFAPSTQSSPSRADAVGSTRLRVDGQTVRRPGPAELHPRHFQTRRRRIDALLSWGVPILIFAVWEVTGQLGVLDTRFFPPPSTIWDAAVASVRDGSLTSAIVVSARKVVIGFILGTLTGVAVGIALGISRVLRAALEPLIVALYTVPKLSLLPVLLLIFGLGELPQILLIAISVFFLISISTVAAMVAVPGPYLETAHSFQATRMQTFRHVQLPASLPAIGTAMRLSAGMSVLVMVGIEFLLGGEGLGNLIWSSWTLFLPERMYVGIVVVGVFGLVFTNVVTYVARRSAPWADNERMVIT